MESRNTIPQFLSTSDQPHGVWMQQVTGQLASTFLVIRAGISWIFELGIRPEMPFYLRKNLGLINRVTFVSLLLALPASFLLLLARFDHPVSLLVSGTVALCAILVLNRVGLVEWSQAIFAYFPSAIIMSYAFITLISRGLVDPLVYILVRQGLCLSLLLPVILYGFEKVHRGMVLGSGALIFLAFDVVSMKWSTSLLANTIGMNPGLFSLLSLMQLIGLSICVLYVQATMLSHAQQVRLSNEKLRHMAIRDGMTGLFNHAFIEQLIADAINRSKRSGNPLSLLMIDVDNFKQINDSSGHNAGDAVLVQLARLLKSSKRSTDYLGRWGGDELILLLTDTNLQGASKVAEKLRLLVENYIFPGQVRLTISLGASEYAEGDTLAGLIGRVDACLYRAKRFGRNCVEIQ